MQGHARSAKEYDLAVVPCIEQVAGNIWAVGSEPHTAFITFPRSVVKSVVYFGEPLERLATRLRRG